MAMEWKAKFSFLDLAVLLYNVRKAKCREPSDKIYSLLGFIDWSLTPTIDPLLPDYEISLEGLAERIVMMTIIVERTHQWSQEGGRSVVPDLRMHFEKYWQIPRDISGQWLQGHVSLSQGKASVPET